MNVITKFYKTSSSLFKKWHTKNGLLGVNDFFVYIADELALLKKIKLKLKYDK